jgi:RNA polymerase sigma factor (sigma-70 family)
VIEKVEEKVRDAHQRRDVDAMTTAVIEGYGPEIYGFLVSTHGGFGDADEVFSQFAEKLWTTFDRFEMRCAARTWAYRVARSVSADWFRQGRRGAEVPLSKASRLSQLAVEIRSATASHLKTERKTELQRLREELEPDDRALLVLRVDRDLPWKALARIFLEDRDEAFDDEAVVREAARLRQRYQTIKRRLRELGRERGLLS